MSPAEAQVLLSMAAAFDNRKPDADAAKAWAAALSDVRFDDARVALVEHYKTSTDWLMPAMVRAAVRRLRSKRIAEHPPVNPPPDLSPAEYRRWNRELLARIGSGEQIDPDYAYAGQLVKRDMRELTARATPDASNHAQRIRAGLRGIEEEA